MRQNTYQPSRSDTRQAKQNSQLPDSVEDISHLTSKLQENKPPENMVYQTFLRQELRQQESRLSSQENERQETKHIVAQPVLSAKHSSIQSTSDPDSPPDQIFKRQDDSPKSPTARSPNIKPEIEEIESREVEPQDPMSIKLSLNQHALDSELSLSQSKTDNEKMNSRKLPMKAKKPSTMSGNFAFLKGALAKQVKTEELSQDDVIIAVMGPTGSGKSTFIEIATGLDTGVGHTLESCTSEIKIVKLSVPELTDGDVIFVDTPGFDDTHKSDADILKMVADWLKTTYEKEILLSGLLYFHRISDNRMAGTPLKNLRMFEELCGKNAFHNVILTTTMWDEVDEEIGRTREQQLKSMYWRSMLERNSTTSRFMGSRESALQLIEPLIDAANKKTSLLLQQEMVDMRSKLPATSAGVRLFSEMELLIKERQDALEKIRNAMKHNRASLPALHEERQRLKMQLDATASEMRKLRLPLGKRLSRMSRKWLSFRFSF